MAGADFGAARDGARAAAGSAGRSAAGIFARRIDARNAISPERREPVRRGGCGGGAGSRNLVAAAPSVDFEDPRDDGNSAQGIPVDCREPELRGSFLRRGSSVAAEVGIFRLLPRRENILKHSGNSNFVMRKAGTDGEPFRASDFSRGVSRTAVAGSCVARGRPAARRLGGGSAARTRGRYARRILSSIESAPIDRKTPAAGARALWSALFSRTYFSTRGPTEGSRRGIVRKRANRRGSSQVFARARDGRRAVPRRLPFRERAAARNAQSHGPCRAAHGACGNRGQLSLLPGGVRLQSRLDHAGLYGPDRPGSKMDRLSGHTEKHSRDLGRVHLKRDPSPRWSFRTDSLRRLSG